MLSACKSVNQADKVNKSLTRQFAYHLSDSLASQEAIILYNNLFSLSGKSVLIGHQDALAYGIGWAGEEFRSDINDVCGDFPAVFGWDLGHIGETDNIDGVPFSRMQQWAVEAYKKGGINTYSWHIGNFATGGNAWDISPCVSKVLPGGENHDAFLLKLDLMADFFSGLKKDNGDLIPVIFRPWHEMNGGWFWWGSKSCTPAEYQELYRYTISYLRNVKQLHNIIYAYSPDVFESAEQYLTFYPGDEYVDILGVDDYRGLSNKQETHRTIAMLEIMDKLAKERSKLFAVTETGLETIPDPEWFTGVVLPTLAANASTVRTSWILFWRNGRPDHFYAPYPGHPSAEDFIKFKNDSLTFFLSDITDIYSRKDN
jgi:mannan endo-1,4-beta-mannosidase